jgi:hypothetical protein
MRRTTIKWKNTSGRLVLSNGKKVGPGAIFQARPEDISNSFRDVVIPLEPLPEETPLQSVTEYQAVSKGGGWYDVVNTATKKVMNTGSLRLDKAKELVAQLQGEDEKEPEDTEENG